MTMTGSGFSVRIVQRLAGISYRQLDYWDTTRLVGSSIRQAAGRGSRRVYSFEDVVALRVVAKLRRAGVSVQAIRKALAYLKQHASKPLMTLQLIPEGKRVLVQTEDPSRHIDATAKGQVVITVPVGPITRELQQKVDELRAPQEIAVRVAGRTYTAVLTPDLEAGGFTVTVPEVPGCITEGDTLPEARRMVREALELCLETVPGEVGRVRAAAVRGR